MKQCSMNSRLVWSGVFTVLYVEVPVLNRNTSPLGFCYMQCVSIIVLINWYVFNFICS
jgi:hypothetical protein